MCIYNVCMHVLNLVSISQCFLPCCSIVTADFDCVMYFDCRLLLLGCGMDLCFHSVFILPRLSVTFENLFVLNICLMHFENPLHPEIPLICCLFWTCVNKLSICNGIFA